MERTLRITHFGGTRSRVRSKKLKITTITIKLLKRNPLISVTDKVTHRPGHSAGVVPSVSWGYYESQITCK